MTNLFAKLGFGAAMLAGFALAPVAYASSWSHAGHSQSSHSSPSSGVHAGAPRSYSGPMPSHGFHSAPPGFRAAPRGFNGSGRPEMHGEFSREFHGGPSGEFRGGPSHDVHGGVSHDFHGGSGQDFHGSFHGHDFAHFSAHERETWQHGNWRHSWHNGHFGWWWYVDNYWFFYPEAIYPYPTYVGPDYYYEPDEYDDSGYGSDYSWYWCNDPQGYYPYVQQCNEDWQPVSPTPPPPPGRGYDNQGGYNDRNGDSPREDDDGPNQ